MSSSNSNPARLSGTQFHLPSPKRGKLCLLLLICALFNGCSTSKPASAPHPPASSAKETALATVRRRPEDPAARLQLAQLDANAGDTFAAIEQLEVARQLGDHDDDLLRRLADLYNRLGEPEAAANTLASAATRPHASDLLRLTYSQTLLTLGAFDAAAKAVRPLLAHWRALPDQTQQYLVRALLLAGQAQQAGKLLPQANSDPPWLALAGLQALLSGQPKAAVAALTRSVAGSPQEGWNAYLLGQACWASGEAGKALAAWRTAAGLPNAPADAAIGAAQVLVQSKRLAAAEGLLQGLGGEDRKAPGYWEVEAQVAQQRKQGVLGQIALGFAAYNRGDPWQAEAIWRTAIPQAQAQADDAWALYTDIFNSALRRQDAQAALRYVTEATRRFPHDYYLLKSRAELLLDQNRLAAAEATAESLPPLEPPDQAGQAADLLARIALKFGKPDLLQQSVQRERELAPHNPNALLYQVEWQFQQKWTQQNLESALKLCKDAISIAPNNAESYFRAGLLLKELQRPQEAMSMLLHALTLAPRLQDGAPNAILAQIEQHQGLIQESRFELEQNRRLRTLKDEWPSRVKLLYQIHSAPSLAEWKALGELALDRHETWVALCAATRATRMAPRDRDSWQLLAAAWHRLGRFEESLAAMQAAHPAPSNR